MGDLPSDLAARHTEHVRNLDRSVRRLVDTLTNVEGVRRVSLFGSYARGRRDLFTELDVLVWSGTPTWHSSNG